MKVLAMSLECHFSRRRVSEKSDIRMLAYVDDISLYADIPSPTTRQVIADSLTVDSMITHPWCSRWGMKLYSSKSKEMIVYRPRTQLPQLPSLLIKGMLITSVDHLKLLDVTLNQRLRNMVRPYSSKSSIIRKCIYENDNIAHRCFFSFILCIVLLCGYMLRLKVVWSFFYSH